MFADVFSTDSEFDGNESGNSGLQTPMFFVKLGVGGSFRNFILKHADDAHQSLHIHRGLHL